MALDHRLTWQIRHLATDAAAVAQLAAAYQSSEPCPESRRPTTRIAEDVRKVELDPTEPAAEHALSRAGSLPRAVADGILPLGLSSTVCSCGRESDSAVQAYRDLIAGSAEPEPDAWIGLGLALHRRPPARPGSRSPPAWRSCSTCMPAWARTPIPWT